MRFSAEMFVLLEEQRDAYNYVLHVVERARRSDEKTTVIISGGPGSGKSVIALSLLGSSRDRVGPSSTPPGLVRSPRR